ncbi:GntR family transcriptional regulator, partial [Phaeobacter sp. J2-8]
MSDLAIAPLADAPVKSATEQVFDALYEAVISLQLTPGTKVSEIEVAKQLGVSRQPVRDAFFRLSNLGFLAIRPQRATL